MPITLETSPPKAYQGTCPICHSVVFAYFYDDSEVVRDFCDWCSQWLACEIKQGQLVITTKDADYTPTRKDEKCPKCGARWELWFHPNGALVKLHGAEYISSGNRVLCDSCGVYAHASLT